MGTLYDACCAGDSWTDTGCYRETGGNTTQPSNLPFLSLIRLQSGQEETDEIIAHLQLIRLT